MLYTYLLWTCCATSCRQMRNKSKQWSMCIRVLALRFCSRWFRKLSCRSSDSNVLPWHRGQPRFLHSLWCRAELVRFSWNDGRCHVLRPRGDRSEYSVHNHSKSWHTSKTLHFWSLDNQNGSVYNIVMPFKLLNFIIGLSTV